MSRRQDLIEALILVQRHLETPTDIVTFCGRKGVSVAEIEWHLEYYVRRVQKETDAKIGQFRPQADGSRRLPSRRSSERLGGSEYRTASPHHHARDRW
jgi:hypothetical protein